MKKQLIVIGLMFVGSLASASENTVQRIVSEALATTKMDQHKILAIENIDVFDTDEKITRVNLGDAVKNNAFSITFTTTTNEDLFNYQTDQVTYQCEIFVALEKSANNQFVLDEVSPQCAAIRVPETVKKNQMATWALSWLGYIRNTEKNIYGNKSLFGSLQSQLEKCMTNLSEKDFADKYIHEGNKPVLVKNVGIFQHSDLSKIESLSSSDQKFKALLSLEDASLSDLLDKLAERGRLLDLGQVEQEVQMNLARCKSFKQQYDLQK